MKRAELWYQPGSDENGYFLGPRFRIFEEGKETTVLWAGASYRKGHSVEISCFDLKQWDFSLRVTKKRAMWYDMQQCFPKMIFICYL